MNIDFLSIAFILGSPDINGGTYVIYEHGTRLQQFGHRVTMITEQSIDPARHAWHPAAAELNWLTFDQVKDEQFDIVLATWWQSPFLLHKLSASHYLYFVQSIESRFFEEEDPAHHDKRDLSLWQEFCESSYSFNIPVITEARWIQDYLYQTYNSRAKLVRNGIRKDIYQDKKNIISPRQKGRLRVLVEGPVDVFYKNVPKSIELCHLAGVDEVWLLTSSDVESFPGVDRVFSRIPIHKTPAVYGSCDVLVKLSYIEGMFGPPLEMFHCGGTAIVYDVTGHDEYIVHGENSYVVPRDQDEQVVQYLQELKEQPEKLDILKQGAATTAQNWPDWDHASTEFAQALQQITKQPGASQGYLQSWTEKLNRDNEKRFLAKVEEQFAAREADTEENEQSENFVQLYYWEDAQGLQPQDFQWGKYSGNTAAMVEFDVVITGVPFWIRVDPSVKVGLINIASIEVVNQYSGDTVYLCNTPAHFVELYVAGTLRRLNAPDMATFLSYGEDPQLLLPAISRGEIGDILHIVIKLRETGVSQLFNGDDLFLDGSCASSKCKKIISTLFGRKRSGSFPARR